MIYKGNCRIQVISITKGKGKGKERGDTISLCQIINVHLHKHPVEQEKNGLAGVLVLIRTIFTPMYL